MITALQSSPVNLRAAVPASSVASSQPPAPPQDTVETPLRKALSHMNPYLAGAVIGVGTLDPPLVGGAVAGVPGALIGTGLAFGFNYAIDKDPRRSLGTVIWPGIMGLLVSTSAAAPTPARIGILLGTGAALGVLAVWRNKLENPH